MGNKSVRKYVQLVLTKQVDSTFRALWLVHQTRYILGYSPPDEIFEMAACFATVTEEGIRQMNEEATPTNTKSTCLVNTKSTIPLSVGAKWFRYIYLTAMRFGKY